MRPEADAPAGKDEAAAVRGQGAASAPSAAPAGSSAPLGSPAPLTAPEPPACAPPPTLLRAASRLSARCPAPPAPAGAPGLAPAAAGSAIGQRANGALAPALALAPLESALSECAAALARLSGCIRGPSGSSLPGSGRRAAGLSSHAGGAAQGHQQERPRAAKHRRQAGGAFTRPNCEKGRAGAERPSSEHCCLF